MLRRIILTATIRFTDYAAAKHRIFMNQTADDLAILNADDELTASWAKGLKANVTMFSVKAGT